MNWNSAIEEAIASDDASPRGDGRLTNRLCVRWNAVATAYAELLHQMDRENNLGPGYEPTITAAQMASLAVAQQYKCAVCSELMDMRILITVGQSVGDEMRIARLHYDDAHVYVNCLIVHDRCLEKSCIARLTQAERSLVELVLKNKELRTLFASDIHPLVGCRVDSSAIDTVCVHISNLSHPLCEMK